MASLGEIYAFVDRLNHDAELQARFAEYPEEILDRVGLSDAQKAAMLEGSIEALTQIGLHPLVTMRYSLFRNPGIKTHISIKGYLSELPK